MSALSIWHMDLNLTCKSHLLRPSTYQRQDLCTPPCQRRDSLHAGLVFLLRRGPRRGSDKLEDLDSGINKHLIEIHDEMTRLT